MSVAVDEYESPGDPILGLFADRERFRVDDDAKAAWAMRKARSIIARIREVEAIRDAEIARVNEWAATQIDGMSQDRDYFEGLLVMYARQQREDEGRKSVVTPYGTVKSRAGQPRWQVYEPTDFLAWARDHRPDLIRVKEEPAVSLIKEVCSALPDGSAVTEDGEQVPGVSVRPAETTYAVEVTL